MNEIELKECPFCGNKPTVIARYWNYEKPTYQVKCKLCGTTTRESSSEKYIIDFWNQRFTGKPKTYRQYFEENFPKDKFPNADYEGMCREMFFGNDNGDCNCAYGETSCEKCWDEEIK